MIFDNQVVGEMKASEILRQRAAETAARMHTEKIATTTIDLFEDSEGGRESRGKGAISTLPSEIPIIIGSLSFEGTTYYFGLPKTEP